MVNTGLAKPHSVSDKRMGILKFAETCHTFNQIHVTFLTYLLITFLKRFLLSLCSLLPPDDGLFLFDQLLRGVSGKSILLENISSKIWSSILQPCWLMTGCLSHTCDCLPCCYHWSTRVPGRETHLEKTWSRQDLPQQTCQHHPDKQHPYNLKIRIPIQGVKTMESSSTWSKA